MSNGDSMAKSESKTVVISDAGPIIHLDELAHLDLLSDFIPVIISKTVYSEIATHRPEALKHPDEYITKKEDMK